MLSDQKTPQVVFCFFVFCYTSPSRNPGESWKLFCSCRKKGGQETIAATSYIHTEREFLPPSLFLPPQNFLSSSRSARARSSFSPGAKEKQQLLEQMEPLPPPAGFFFFTLLAQLYFLARDSSCPLLPPHSRAFQLSLPLPLPLSSTFCVRLSCTALFRAHLCCQR